MMKTPQNIKPLNPSVRWCALKRTSLLIFLLIVSYGKTFASLPDSYEGARPMGMGGAFVAIADDSNAMFYNPAGSAFLKGTIVDLTYGINSPGNSSASVLNITHSFGEMGCLGLGVSYREIKKDAPDPSIDRLQDGFTYFLLSYAKAIDEKLSVGANYRSVDRFVWPDYLWPPTEHLRASGSGLDLGLLYKVSDDLKVGISAVNLINTGLTWYSGSEEAIYSKIKTGFSYKTLEDKLLLSMDINYRQDEASINFGGEYEALKWLFLRGGYNSEQDRAGALSVGIGLKNGVWALDIASLSGNGGMNYLSSGMNW